MSKESILDLTFGAGIDESQRPELMDPRAGFVTRENLRQDQVGGASKRFGFAPLGLARFDGTNRSTGFKLFADADTIGVMSGNYAEVYDVSAAKWRQFRAIEAGYSLSDLPSAGPSTNVDDIETCNGHLAVVSLTPTDAWASILEIATGAMAFAPIKLAGSQASVRVASFSGRYFVAVYGDGSAVTAQIFDTQNFNAGWTALATIAASGAGIFSVCSLADRIAVAYNTGSGTDRVTVKTYDQTGLKETATINTTSITPTAVDIAGSNADTLWIAWEESTNVKIKGLTGNNLASVKATTATILALTSTPAANGIRVAVSATAGKGRLCCRCGTRSEMRGFQTSAGAAATDGSQTTLFNAYPLGRPLTYGGRYYMVFHSQGAVSATLDANSGVALCDWTDDVAYLRPIASLAPSLVTFGSTVCKIVTGATSAQQLFGLSITRSAAATTARLVTFDFADSRRWMSVRHGSSVVLTGACTSYSDGTGIYEVGFIAKPTLPTATTGGTGVSLTNGRRYVAVYEDVDADGNWIVSGISDPCATTGPVANKTITIGTSPLTISNRLGRAGVRVVFYATLDSNVNQPPYYRLAEVVNDTSVTAVTTTDTVSDATLATRAKLYAPNLPGSAGESLDRRGPAGMMYLESYNGMLVGSEGQNIFWSGQPVDGEATWFSPLFQQPFPGCTGLKAQDGVLYAFKRREVHAIVGDAPSDNGQSGGLGLPRKLSGEVGCIDTRSLVTTSMGIFFQSERGIEILAGGGQQMTWIGEQVQETTAAYPICTSATLDASENVVYFEMAAAETANQVSGTGRTLVYDLTKRNWTSTDRRKNSAGTADTPAQSGAIVYTGSAYRYAWLGTDGVVYVEDRTTHLDPGSTWVTAKAVFSWAHAAGTHGEQTIDRYLFLASSATAHDLTVRLDFDYDTSKTETKLWTAAMLSALTTEWIDKEFERSTSTAVRITLSDATPSSGTVGTGEGATWISLALPGAAHRSVKRTSAAQRGG